MSVKSEFRDFIQRGNVVDLAVGVVVGLAFGKVVTSFVENVLMPPLGPVLGRVNFADMLVALGVFLIVKAINRFHQAAKSRECPFCMTAIAEAATRCPACTKRRDARAL